MFDTLTDQNKAVLRLLTLFSKNTVPHALLFTGIEGIGKRTAARAFAMTLNCSESEKKKDPLCVSGDAVSVYPCGVCRSCKKILSDSHPDIISIKPAGNLIKIAQIRDLCAKLLIKPNEAKTRVVIIHDAHAMNVESSNALLKSLEEPPSNTMFILVTNQASDLLATIVSRCQQIGFSPLSKNGIETCLISNGVAPDKAMLYASMAGGSMGKALSLARQSESNRSLFALRQWIADQVEMIGQGSVSSSLLFAEKLSSKKETAMELLDVMYTVIRDIIIYRCMPDAIVNKDLEQTIARLSNRFSITGLLSMGANIQKAQQNIKGNAALRLSLETMAIQLSRV